MLMRSRTLRVLRELRREVGELRSELTAIRVGLTADTEAQISAPVVGPESRALIKDWLTALVSMTGILLAAVLAGLGILHNAVPSFSWSRLWADIAGGLTATSLVIGISLALRALGFLITGTRSVEYARAAPNQAEEEVCHANVMFGRAARNAVRAQKCLIVAVVGIVVFAAGALTALNLHQSEKKEQTTATVTTAVTSTVTTAVETVKGK